MIDQFVADYGVEILFTVGIILIALSSPRGKKGLASDLYPKQRTGKECKKTASTKLR